MPCFFVKIMKISKIAFTSDFGLQDHYVAVTKSIILRSAKRDLFFIDVSHNVGRQNLWRGAYVSATAAKYIGSDSLHLIVVDPTVGTDRKIVVYESDDNGIFVAPDNGVLTHAYNWFSGQAYYAKAESKLASRTFQARDVFAPLVAKIIDETDRANIMIPINKEQLVKLRLKAIETANQVITATVLYVDVFGNIITNIPNGQIQQKPIDLLKDGKTFKLRQVPTYSYGDRDELLLIEGSEGYYEISINKGSAASVLQINEGEEVKILEGDPD
jgi:S-adenosylmethionine hydrolase